MPVSGLVPIPTTGVVRDWNWKVVAPVVSLATRGGIGKGWDTKTVIERIQIVPHRVPNVGTWDDCVSAMPHIRN